MNFAKDVLPMAHAQSKHLLIFLNSVAI